MVWCGVCLSDELVLSCPCVLLHTQAVYPIWDYPVVREYVTAATGGKCSFPALETAPGVVMLESQDIIEKLAADHPSVDTSKIRLKGPTTGVVGTPTQVVLHTFDHKGRRRSTGGDQFTCALRNNTALPEDPAAEVPVLTLEVGSGPWEYLILSSQAMLSSPAPAGSGFWVWPGV